jgi:alkanesulfonate monooxygenase SsuD/methylene tetrahydromethanopterin reductase-like flavin-dependent oxidoreductase (luciferase family)
VAVASRGVRFGLQMPQAGPNADRTFLAQFIRHAAQSGIRAFWVGDHIVLGGYQHRAKEQEVFLDPLVLLAYAAALDPDIELGTSVLVAPYRNAFALLKGLCSLSHLMQRRLVLGVGAGWAEQEFDVVGADFRRRGHTTDQFCEVFDRLSARPEQAWQVGPYRYSGGGFHPLPAPTMELWVGGNSLPARRRAARYATGWQPTGLDPDAVAEGMAEVRRLAEAGGRDPGEIVSAVRLRLRILPETYRTVIPSLLDQYLDAGVTDFLVELNSRDRDYTLTAIERLAECLELLGVRQPLPADAQVRT